MRVARGIIKTVEKWGHIFLDNSELCEVRRGSSSDGFWRLIGDARLSGADNFSIFFGVLYKKIGIFENIFVFRRVFYFDKLDIILWHISENILCVDTQLSLYAELILSWVEVKNQIYFSCGRKVHLSSNLRYENRPFNGHLSNAFRTHVWLKGFGHKAVSNVRSLNPQVATSI